MFVGAEHRSLIAIAGFDGSGDFCFCVIKAASLLNLAIALRMRFACAYFWFSFGRVCVRGCVSLSLCCAVRCAVLLLPRRFFVLFNWTLAFFPSQAHLCAQ